jgi:hypothetical protein
VKGGFGFGQSVYFFLCDWFRVLYFPGIDQRRASSPNQKPDSHRL